MKPDRRKSQHCLEEHLAGAGDLDGALCAGAALHEIAAAAGLVDQSETMERAHHAPVARVHHPLWGITLACANPMEVSGVLLGIKTGRPLLDEIAQRYSLETWHLTSP